MVERRRIDPQARVDLVPGMPRIDVPREFLGMRRARIARVEVLHIAQCQPFETERQITAGEIFDNTVEPSAALGVIAGLAHHPEPFRVHQSVEFGARGVEQRQLGEILRGRGVGVEPVDDPDAIDDTAFDQRALIRLRMEFERGNGDMPAHRLAVDDRPARLPEAVDEMRPQGQEVEQEPVGMVSPGAVARRRPGIAALRQMLVERFVVHHAAAGAFALITMREHDEPAIPIRRHIDQIRRIPQHAPISPRRLRGMGDESEEYDKTGDRGGEDAAPRRRMG